MLGRIVGRKKFHFFDDFFCFVNKGPYGSDISKHHPSYNLNWTYLSLTWNSPERALPNAFRDFKNFWFLTFFSNLKFTIVPLGKSICKKSDRRVKQTEIWDSEVPVAHTRGILNVLAFKVIFGSFGAFAIFQKIIFPKRCFFYIYNSFSIFYKCSLWQSTQIILFGKLWN